MSLNTELREICGKHLLQYKTDIRTNMQIMIWMCLVKLTKLIEE